MAETPESTIDPKDLDDNPYVLGEKPKTETSGGIVGLGKKKAPKNNSSTNTSTNPPGKTGEAGIKAMGAGNAILSGISGLTGFASKMGDASRKLTQTVLNPSPLGLKEMNGFADTTKMTADAVQGGVKGIGDWNKKRKADAASRLHAKANDPAFKKELEEYREQALDRFENAPFDQKNAIMKEIDDEVMARFKARGLDPKYMDKNSDIAQWYTGFVGELKGIMNGEGKDRETQRRLGRADREMWKNKARFDYKDAEKKGRFARIKNMKMVKKLSNSKDPQYWAMGRAIANIDRNGDIDPRNPDDLAKYSDKILTELKRMSVTTPKLADRVKYRDAFEEFQRQVNQHKYNLDTVSKDFADRITLDLGRSIDESLKDSGAIVRKDSYGVPVEGVNSYVTVANKRMDHIMTEMMKLDAKTRGPDGKFVDPNDEKQYQELINQFSRVKTDQDLGTLGRLYSEIGTGVNDLLWTTNGHLLDENDMVRLNQGYANDMNDIVRYLTKTPNRKDDAFVYQLMDQTTGSYMRGFASLQLGKAAEILDRASGLSVPITPPGNLSDPDLLNKWYLESHKRNPSGARAGLNLTIGDLIDHNLIAKTDPFIRAYMLDEDGNYSKDKENIARQMTLADVVTKNVYGELRRVNADAGRITKENGMPVGESESEILRKTNSLVAQLAKNLGSGETLKKEMAATGDLLNPSAERRGIPKSFIVKGDNGYDATYDVGETPIQVDADGTITFDPARTSPMIGGTNFAAILNTPGAYSTPFQAYCAALGICRKSLNGIQAIEAGNVIEPKLLKYVNDNPKQFNDMTSAALSKNPKIKHIPVIKSIIHGKDLDSRYGYMDTAGKGKRRSDFIDKEFNGIFGGKKDGIVIETGPNGKDIETVVDAKAISGKELGNWGITMNKDGTYNLSNVKIPNQYKMQLALYNHYLDNGAQDHAWLAVTFKDPTDNDTKGASWTGNERPQTFMIYVGLNDKDTVKAMKSASSELSKIKSSGKLPAPVTDEDKAIYKQITGRDYVPPGKKKKIVEPPVI